MQRLLGTEEHLPALRSALASLRHYRLNWEGISADRFDRECPSQWRRDVPTYLYYPLVDWELAAYLKPRF
jgi:hypothetical protein